MTGKEQEKDLIVVTAVEEYSHSHHLSVRDTLLLFLKHHIPEILRSQYEVLHTLDPEESAEFAESLLRGASEN